jgi:hypothetical protein
MADIVSSTADKSEVERPSLGSGRTCRSAKYILLVVISDVMLGVAAYASAMSSGCPIDLAPTKWRDADLDTLLAIEPMHYDSSSETQSR